MFCHQQNIFTIVRCCVYSSWSSGSLFQHTSLQVWVFNFHQMVGYSSLRHNNILISVKKTVIFLLALSLNISVDTKQVSLAIKIFVLPHLSQLPTSNGLSLLPACLHLLSGLGKTSTLTGFAMGMLSWTFSSCRPWPQAWTANVNSTWQDSEKWRSFTSLLSLLFFTSFYYIWLSTKV